MIVIIKRSITIGRTKRAKIPTPKLFKGEVNNLSANVIQKFGLMNRMTNQTTKAASKLYKAVNKVGT